MGPEPLIFPLACIGLIGLVIAAVQIVKARGRSWLAVLLVAGICFAAWGAQGTANIYHTMWIFFMALGFFVIASAAVIALGALMLRPFKPQLARLAGRLGFTKQLPPPS
jgi:uncharacterized membrane protein